MKEIIAKKEFTLNGIYYDIGKKIETTSFEQILKLNELGLIEPLNRKELENYKNVKKEEKVWDKQEEANSHTI